MAGVTDLRRVIRELNERLCALIRQGVFDDSARWRDLARLLRPLVIRKLEVANPRLVTRQSKSGNP